MPFNAATAANRAETFRHAARQAPPADSPLPGINLHELLRLYGDDSAAVLLMLLALLSVAPVAGVGSVLSLVIVAIAWRWHQGVNASILPQRLAQLRLNARWSQRCLHTLAWLHEMADRHLRQRWQGLSHPRTHGPWRLWIAVMAFLIFLPLPMGNVLPAFSLVLLSLGWMFRDGLALLLSAAVGAGAIGFAATVFHVVVAMVQTTWQWTERLTAGAL